MMYSIDSPEAYQRSIKHLEWLAEHHGLDERELRELRTLYDTCYWLKRDKEQLDQQLAETQAELSALRGRHNAPGSSLNVLIPATYKPVRVLK